MKCAVQLQTDVGKDFRAITMEMNRRVGVLECSINLAHGDDMDTPAVSVGAHGLGDVAGGAAPLGTFGFSSATWATALSVEDATATDGPSGLTSLTGSPKWSHVAKKG